MPRNNTVRLFAAAAFAGLLASLAGGGAGSVAAQGQAASASRAQAAITARQEHMKAIGGAFKALRGELEKAGPDFALIAAKASDINARARKVGGLFPAGTGNADGFKTTALPTIWKNPAGFKAASQKLVDESAKLASLAGQRNKAAVAAQAGAMGGACKGCHDQFRTETK